MSADRLYLDPTHFAKNDEDPPILRFVHVHFKDFLTKLGNATLLNWQENKTISTMNTANECLNWISSNGMIQGNVTLSS